MKNILKSLVIVVAVAAIAGVATYAVFSETERINHNTIATARVDIDLRALASGQISKPFNVSGLIPGQFTGWGRVDIYNTSSSTAVELFVYVDNISGAACDKTNLQVTTGFAGSDVNERANDVYNGSLAGITGAANRKEITGVISPTLPANESRVIQQRAQLDASADNTYQNTICAWDEFFVAETPTL